MTKNDGCSEIVVGLIKSDPKISERIKEISISSITIHCRDCSSDGIEGKARATLMDHPLEIVLCSNRLDNRKSVREALIHELVHAYDYRNQRYDLLTCDGLAASEIRAAREAECEYLSSIPLIPSWMMAPCVKFHATRSTANLFPPQETNDCIHRMFKQAMDDVYPSRSTEGDKKNG